MFALTFALSPLASHYAFLSYPIHPGLGAKFPREVGIAVAAARSRGSSQQFQRAGKRLPRYGEERECGRYFATCCGLMLLESSMTNM